MAESKTRLPQSQIPVKASGSRQAQNVPSLSLSSPHFHFASPSQHLSVSDSPTHPSPSTSVTPNPSAGITTFRSFRNLLPFGPTKLPSTGTHPATPSKGSPFGAIRRSMNGERSVSAPVLRPKKSQEGSPLLPIELSHTVDEPLIRPEDLRGGLGLYMKQPEPPPPQSAPPTSQRFHQSAVSPPSPKPVGLSDLSTIMESETSGISKCSPNLDDSPDNPKKAGPQDKSKAHQSSPPSQASETVYLVAPASDHERIPSPGSQDTSALDLSTSKVTSEVLEALANDRQQGWVHGIVIDDVDPPVAGHSDDPDASFNLNGVDPELAALLSPYRIRSADSGPLQSVGSLTLPPTTPQMTDNHLVSPAASPYTPLTPGAPSSSKPPSTHTSPVLTARSAISHSSPVRRPALLSRTTSASVMSPSASPPTRSPSHQSRALLPSPPIHGSSERASDIGERPSSASLAASRRKYSQIMGENDAPRRPNTGGDSETRRPILSRLMTPVRPALQLTPASGSRSTLRGGSTKTSPSAWDGDSISPSRPPSSVGTSHGRPSLDSSADRFKNSSLIRGRDRSASVTERPSTYYGSTSRPPATEWLGPRTAKAFAAAGLIDMDKESSQAGPSRPASRFGGRAQSERDNRSQYAPSRMAFSEAGSASSWGRRSGSISRPAMSEINGPMSESASTPRTTFSTGSTALTSVSSSSVHLQSELQAIQDKHALETGALLNALADSQRTSKMLRDENTELRDRLHELETRLADAVNEIQRLQYQTSVQQTASSYTRSTYQRSSSLRPADVVGVRRRPSALQTVIHADAADGIDDGPSDIHLHAPSSHISSARSSSESRREDLYVPPHPKRFSNSSSIFPVPPSTMSMLLHEDGLAPETFSSHSRSPPSPTATLSRFSSRQSQGSSYGHHRSTSASTAMTAGNISPTTANFSMLTGSPMSLSLRPEHERLLGDMPPLNLSSDDYDLDGDDS